MEELSNIHIVAIWGFCIALVFGFVGNKTHFCTMGAISDVVNMGARGRMGAWFAGIGIAVLGVQILRSFGFISLGDSMYLSTQFLILSYVLGGFIFGIGMTLAAGCGQRNLVRVGGGNLKSLVVVIVLGVTAYMTLRGLLALLRINYIYKADIELQDLGMNSQSLSQGVSALTGIPDGTAMQIILALIIGVGFLAYAIKQEEFRTSFDNILAGLAVGGCVVAAWFVTGYIGQDDFDPIAPQGLTFIGPTGNTLSYLMTFTGAQINFGIAVTFGMIFGSFIYAIISGTFRIETFSNQSEMVGHLIGAVMMGFGGVLSFGCTIGQGVTGISTMAIGSFITLLMIVFGSALTMKVQYHMLDEKSFIPAVFTGAAELLNPFHKEE
ncbi:MAG: YeeE/YedE family protein [Gammaproteobacteria bacterium]|nr:YeeE/YedE family protein [Gammaproteobacteria bacterium]